MLILHCLFILTIIPSVTLFGQPLFTNQIIDTLTRALQFFSSHVHEVNLDAGIGTRMAADQLRSYTMCRHCQSVKDLVDLSEYVTWKIDQSVRQRQPEYYAKVSFLIKPGMYSNLVPFKYRQNKNKISIEETCSSSPFIEKYSDECLHSLMIGKCNHTGSCTRLMSDPYACRYSLTHQIFYSIIVKKSACFEHRLSARQDHRLISKMLLENHQIAAGHFQETDRDLFMEQIAFGGLVGWKEFFESESFFQTIIDWQHPTEGCYGNDTNPLMINKREEMQMAQHCLSHRTSVAIAALSQMLRYLLSRDI
ncbi:unnamed protein product [Adineta ricciae]|uniref:Uncharacterized protein n=1 Tax=Adineta ricciae TaxID=249248 RepID=A0A814D734_ADIRI|nr:unnamed protein product [Adineta ricciae]CAF1634764.1 unnamed protein product [Adineta ricciae]